METERIGNGRILVAMGLATLLPRCVVPPMRRPAARCAVGERRVLVPGPGDGTIQIQVIAPTTRRSAPTGPG